MATSFNAYNLINQRLDSDELKTVLTFCSDNYAGCIHSSSEANPLTISGASITLSGDASFIVDGFLVDSTDLNYTQSLTALNNFCGIVIDLGAIKSTANITTSVVTENVFIGLISGFTVTYNSETGIATILKDGEGWNPYKYDTQKFEDITVGGQAKSSSELCVIPLAVFDSVSGTAINLLGYRTKSSLEEFLTLAEYNALLDTLRNEFNSRFVWRAGGEDKGNIGNLNVTANTIKATSGDNIHLDTTSLYADKLKSTTVVGSETADNALFINSDGLVKSDVLPISAGGTGGRTRSEAKQRLGIFSGYSLPPASLYMDGDIFLKIIE